MNMDNYLISVIVPIYNAGNYLARCIDSITNQTHRNLEIILVNDGSTDNSGEIADDYSKKDRRIRVIHQQNQGVSSARNAGIDVASGDYICFSDGDDWLEPDYVEYLLDIAVKTNAEISVTKEVFTNFDTNQTVHDKVEIYSAEKATAEILYYKIPIGVYSKIFKRNFIYRGIRFLPELHIGEGFNFNTAAFQRANIVGVGHRKIYHYRSDNPESATTKFAIDKWTNGLFALERIKSDFITKVRKLDIAWEYANWKTHRSVFEHLLSSSSEKKYPEMYKKCLRVIRTKAIYAELVPVRPTEKIGALVQIISPRLMLKLRRIYHKYKPK